MKTKRLFVGAMGLLLGFAAATCAQTSKLAIGLDYGASIIQKGSLSIGDPVSSNNVVYSDFMVPRHVRAHLEYGPASRLVVRLAAGYGFMRDQANFTRNVAGNGISGRLHRETKFSVAGFPVEASLIWRLPLDNGKRFSVHGGLGGGFYSYKFKVKQFYEIIDSSNPAANERGEFEAPDLKLSGFAQFFLAGFALTLNKKLHATFEISKMGLSLLKWNSEHEQSAGEVAKVTSKRDYNAGRGFDDVAMTIGLGLKLGK